MTFIAILPKEALKLRASCNASMQPKQSNQHRTNIPTNIPTNVRWERIQHSTRKEKRRAKISLYRTPHWALGCNRVFRHTASLGSYCQAAYALKELGIRQFAGPFDWVVSDARMQVHCLKDGFRDFLNPRYYRASRDREAFAAHRLFGPRTFVHRDPRRKRDLLYFQRCVKRFHSLLDNKAEDKFFLQVWSGSPLPVAGALTRCRKEDSCSNYQSVYEFLRERTANFLFVVILLRMASHRKLTVLIDTPSLVVFDLQHISPSLGFHFAVADDNELFYAAFRGFTFAIPGPSTERNARPTKIIEL